MQTKPNRITDVKHQKMINRSACGFWLFVLASLSMANLYAEGFRNPPPGTFDLGRAGGRIAQVDDSSAVQQNPANLVDVTNREFQLTPSVVYIGVDYHAQSGESASTRDPLKLLPNLFFSLPSKNDKAAFGIGITIPYGLSMEWKKNTSAFADPATWRYNATYFAALTTININPTFSFRLSDSISFGAGFDLTWSELEFKQFAPPPFPDGLELKAKGDGYGYGGNFGITWQITDKQRLAFTYRSPMDVSYDGHYTVSSLARGDFGSQIKFPTIISVGYGLQINDAIRLESDVEWLQFSRFKNLPANLNGLADINTPENWRDTFTAGFGGDWKFSDHWVLRGGYQFYQSPVPDSTF
jgi:long-chain fatty acid transport protein